jgi:hypothetical protein
MLDSQFSKWSCQAVHDSCLTTTGSSYNHESVTHKWCFIKLDDLIGPFWLVNEIVLSHYFSNGSFLFLINFLRNITLWGWIQCWESISEEWKEKTNIVEYELRKIHISEGSCKNKIFILGKILSLWCTGSSQYWKNVSQTKIIMSLFW